MGQAVESDVSPGASSTYTLKSIDELTAIHHGAVRLAGAELDLQSFGMQVLDFPAGFSDYPEHDHSADGQEEVYVILNGSAEAVIDGESVPVRTGQMIRVAPEARRKLVTGSEGARILAVGAVANASYERPEQFRIEVRA